MIERAQLPRHPPDNWRRDKSKSPARTKASTPEQIGKQQKEEEAGTKASDQQIN
jgi:hypothetical protein